VIISHQCDLQTHTRSVIHYLIEGADQLDALEQANRRAMILSREAYEIGPIDMLIITVEAASLAAAEQAAARKENR
jgi:hypothetical protein